MDNYQNNLLDKDWFQQIMKSEGGFNPDEPKSVGGKSCAGIGQGPYEDWLKRKCQIDDAPRHVEDLIGSALGTKWEKDSPLEIPVEFGVRNDVIVAFYLDYFSLARLEVVPEPLKYMHADFFVNSKFNANKILQRMCGFRDEVPGEVDGILGPASRERVSALGDTMDPDDMIMAYHERKLAHYASIEKTNKAHYDRNIKGWLRRAQHVLSEEQRWFIDDEPTTSAIDEEDDDDLDLFATEEALLGVEEASEPEITLEPIKFERNEKFAQTSDAELIKSLDEILTELKVRLVIGL